MRTLVGTRPSGRLHIGHYLSVIKPAIEMKADVLVADYHAPSGEVHDFVQELYKYLPQKQIKLQSKMFDSRLYFELLEKTPIGLLLAMPQFKAKEKTALMLTYPVIMATDVAYYDKVVVGDDQRPHLEFARDILPRVGLKPIDIPIPIYVGKIMSLRDSSVKMSKSVPESCLFLDDEDYARKIGRAITDEAGRKNLEVIFKLLGGQDMPELNADLKDKITKLYKEVLCQ